MVRRTQGFDSMFSLCTLHDTPRYIMVSRLINDALIACREIPEVVKVTIIRPDEGMTTEYLYLDKDLLIEHGFTDLDNIVLYDRDKSSMITNNRLVIIKLSRYLCGVCPQCLIGTGFVL